MQRDLLKFLFVYALKIDDILSSTIASTFFSSFSSLPPRAFIPLSAFYLSSHPTIATISKSLPRSSPDIGVIPAILFRKLSSPLSLLLSNLINSCLLHVRLPTPFTMKMIHPHYKQSSTRTSMTSYCPFGYSVALAKILECHLLPQILDKVEHILHPSAHNFLPKRGTHTNLLLFYDELINLLSTNSVVYGLYLDFIKVFDKVDDKLLLAKPEHSYGLTGGTLTLLSSYLIRTQCVQYTNAVSTPFPPLRGFRKALSWALFCLSFIMMISSRHYPPRFPLYWFRMQMT